jgi:hypothetical protein
MTDLARDRLGEIEPQLARSADTFNTPRLRQAITAFDPFDMGSAALLAVLVVLAVATFREYAITNDEWIQHRYGELIVAYYESGFGDRAVFALANLYLYGGLFDSAAVLLSHVVALDPFDLRHLMCALIGVAGLAAAMATARTISGPRAGLITGGFLAVCGSWYGTMFHHTKDIPLAAAMAGSVYFLVRAAHELPHPRLRHIIGFGVLTGAALGIKVLGLLLVGYVGIAVVLNIPAPIVCAPLPTARFVADSLARFLPGLLIAYLIMLIAWPWSALAPLNPFRALFSFADFHYNIRTVLAGVVYRMATVPRLYVPIYLIIKLPLLMLAGAALAAVMAATPSVAGGALRGRQRRDALMIAAVAFFPVFCQVAARGPAFCGLRHFLFVLPPLAILAGIGFDAVVARAAAWGRPFAAMLLALVAADLSWNAVTLYRLHPYEYLVYNPLVGGIAGASRRYAADYWVTMMPEAVDQLEAFLARTEPVESRDPGHYYTVAICGERASFVKKAKQHLHWAQVWEIADFFITPTHMNCDLDSHGKIVVTVERLGVPIGFVKDQRAEGAARARFD